MKFKNHETFILFVFYFFRAFVVNKFRRGALAGL